MPKTYENYSVDGPNQHKANGYIRPEVAKARFLDLYVQTGHFQKTCEIIGLVPRTVYNWKKSDPQFMEDFETADKLALQLLEDEAFRRATYGTEKAVFQQGKLVGYTREYSDTLMIVLLKARAPHKYKERFSGELTGADGKPLMPEVKILHVHSEVPLAMSEDDIDMRKQTEMIEDANVVQELPPPAEPEKKEKEDIISDEDLMEML